MTEPSGPDGSPQKRTLSSAVAEASAIPFALWPAFAGHLLVLIAALTDSIPSTTAIASAIACSIIAVAALSELAPPSVRLPRTIAALTVGHCVAAVVMLAGVASSVPRSLPLAGFAAATALGVVCLTTVARAATVNRPLRPLALAPRVAAIALVVQALLQRWAPSGASASMALRTPIFFATAALGVAALASLSIIALRVRPRWAIAGLLAWTVGWVASTADITSLILWSLGGPFPTGQHQLHQLDADFVQILVTLGGLAIGAALATSIRDARLRHSAVVLLAGHAVFGLMVIVAEHRIALATDFPIISTLRSDRDLAGAIRAFALAGVLWLYWRRVVARPGRAPHRTATRDDE